MDQSKSSDKGAAASNASSKPSELTLPRRGFTTEFFVGIFTVLACLAGGYLAIGLGGVDVGKSTYSLNAEFDNVAGLKYGAAVEIAGVKIGQVKGITLKDPYAIVRLEIDRGVQLRDDDIASIRTKGIIGDRYVKISRGSSSQVIPPGGKLSETESVVDFEDIIGKLIHSFQGGDKKDGK